MSGERGSRYRFGPRERGGALAGWRAGQIVTVAVGLVFGVLLLRWEPNAVGVASAVGILVLYGALATVPVAGRTGDEWLPVVVCWGSRRAGLRGSAQLGALRGMRLLRAGWQDMGVVHDRAARTRTAAASVPGLRCCPRWPATARRCTGCSGWRRPSPTTARACGRTSPP